MTVRHVRLAAAAFGIIAVGGTARSSPAQDSAQIALHCASNLAIGCSRSTDTSAIPVTATGGCSEIKLTYGDKITPGVDPDHYTITRSWTATDTCGQTQTCAQVIQIVPSKPRIAVMPLENLAESEDGARIFARLMQDQFTQMSSVDLVPAGEVETATLRARIRLPVLMDNDQSERLRHALDADYFVLGTVIAYQTSTNSYSGIIPIVGVALQLRDVRTGATLWSDTFHATGDSGEWLFGLGVEHDITKLAHSIARRAAGRIAKVAKAVPCHEPPK